MLSYFVFLPFFDKNEIRCYHLLEVINFIAEQFATNQE